MPCIVINATAARSTGALSILRDLIDYIVCNDCVAVNEYHLFTCIDVFDHVIMHNQSAFNLHKVKVQNWFSRIMWDERGLSSYCKSNDIHPDLIISMQNTSVNFPMVKQLVYYHQPLPLIKYRWNIFNESESVLFLYSKFYGFFVNRHNALSYYVVQLPFIQNLFLQRFRNIPEDRVMTIRPDIKPINTDAIEKIHFDDARFTFFYPSTDISYKNHKVLIDALCLLKLTEPSVLPRIRLVFTVNRLNKRLMNLIEEYELGDTVKFIGLIPFSEILVYYKSVDVLLFPSMIETFGLPLVESAFFGLPIVASDLPYAREVLLDYQNSVFLNPSIPGQWADMFRNAFTLQKTEINSETIRSNSWKSFLEYAVELIHRR